MNIPLLQNGPLIVKPEDAAEFLLGLDIDLESITNALESGELAAQNARTKYHPTTARGLMRWIEMVRALRRSLDEQRNWVPADKSNRPTSYHPERKLTLSIVAGDEFTGDAKGNPNSIRRLGREAALSADRNLGNGGTLALIPVNELVDTQPVVEKLEPADGNWFLLYYRADDEVRAEVSFPFGSKEGRVSSWQIRVLLDPYRPEDLGAQELPIDTGGEDVEFDIEAFGGPAN